MRFSNFLKTTTEILDDPVEKIYYCSSWYSWCWSFACEIEGAIMDFIISYGNELCCFGTFHKWRNALGHPVNWDSCRFDPFQSTLGQTPRIFKSSIYSTLFLTTNNVNYSLNKKLHPDMLFRKTFVVNFSLKFSIIQNLRKNDYFR